jgi:hypothetical protein
MDPNTLARRASEGNPRRHSKTESLRLRFGLVSDFGQLARQISGWTTNLLATGVVLVGGLALGWQALAWWHQEPRRAEVASALSLPDVPALGHGHRFWTRHGSLEVKRVRGSAEDALTAMRAFCCRVETNPERPVTGPGEESLIAQLRNQSPLEATSDVALYQPPGESAMVVALSRSRQRLVGWSFAIPSADDVWSVYHFKPVTASNVESSAAAAENSP